MLVPLVATDGQIEEGLRVLELALAEVQGKKDRITEPGINNHH